MGIHEVAREFHGWVAGPPRRTWSPTDFSRVEGIVDLHLHAGPGRQETYGLAKFASQTGVRAMVLKSPQLGNSVEVARVLNEALADWAPANDVERPTEMVGSVVLGPATGGLNPEFAARMIDSNARILWFPVAAAHWVAWFKQVPLDEARKEGAYVLDGEHLIPEAEEILDVVKEKDVAVSFGHLSKQEMLALAEGCRHRGITRAFIDHPMVPAADLSVDEMVHLARLGVTINFTYYELSPYCGIPAQQMVAAIRAIGVNSVTLSSDSSQEIYSGSVECMRLHAAMLDRYDFSPEEARKMLRDTPLRLLRLGAASV